MAVRNEVEVGAGENIDLKQYEAGMRALLDTYIQADPAEQVATLDEGLVHLIVEKGIRGIDALPSRIRQNPEAVAATIVNNVRKTIVDERALNPKYYDRMSALLDALIEQRNQEAIEYADFLNDLIGLTQQLGKAESTEKYPAWARTAARRALVDFDWPEGSAVDTEHLHDLIQTSKEHGWAGNPMKERALARALIKALPGAFDPDELKRLIALLKEHDEYR